MSEIVKFEGKKLRIITEGEWPEGVTLFDLERVDSQLLNVIRLKNGKAHAMSGFYVVSDKWAIEVQDEKQDEQTCGTVDLKQQIEPVYGNAEDVRSYNVGASDYAKHKIQPWDIWQEYKLDPWEADIIKRVLRKKQGESRKEKYLKIKHVAEEIIRQVEAGEHDDT